MGRFRKKSRTQMIRQRPQRRSQGLTRISSLLSLPNPNPTPRILFFSLLRSQEIIAKKNSIRLLTSTSIPKLPAKDHKSTVAPPARLRACSVREKALCMFVPVRTKACSLVRIDLLRFFIVIRHHFLGGCLQLFFAFRFLPKRILPEVHGSVWK